MITKVSFPIFLTITQVTLSSDEVADVDVNAPAPLPTSGEEAMDQREDKQSSDNVPVQEDINTNSSSSEEQHDVPYFRRLVQNETSNLNELCDKWEKVNPDSNNLTEAGTGFFIECLWVLYLYIN